MAELAAAWDRWAQRVGVVPFGDVIGTYRERGLSETDATLCAVGEATP